MSDFWTIVAALLFVFVGLPLAAGVVMILVQTFVELFDELRRDVRDLLEKAHHIWRLSTHRERRP